MNHEKKIPLIRLAKRDGMEGWKVWCILPLVAFSLTHQPKNIHGLEQSP